MGNLKKGNINQAELSSKVEGVLDLLSPFRRPLIKYTPGWGRSYIPPVQSQREIVAKYKQVPNPQMIKDKRIILVDDSIRRGTQLRGLLREKIWPFKPKEIHGRIASPPQLYPCVYDLSTKHSDLATCKNFENPEDNDFEKYMDSSSSDYKKMVENIGKSLGFTSLQFITLEDMVRAVIEDPNNVNLKKEDLCMYCWTGCY